MNLCIDSCYFYSSFLARDVIYTSCAYATMTVSVCLSVMFVYCGHKVQ